MSFAIKKIAACLVFFSAGSLWAQSVPPVPLQNVVSLSATQEVEVSQDWLTLTLTTARDGADAATVQRQLKVALDGALAEARKVVQPGQVEVRTGHFGLNPRYSKEGKINGWQGVAQLVLEGRDIARLSTMAGQMTGMSVGDVRWGLSREQRLKVEGEAQTEAIKKFKAQATDIAQQFGFSSYTLREVTVNSDNSRMMPAPMQAAMVRMADAAASQIPVEAGKSTVTVNVSGSVQMH